LWCEGSRQEKWETETTIPRTGGTKAIKLNVFWICVQNTAFLNHCKTSANNYCASLVKILFQKNSTTKGLL
jgi:hypothetical protein